MTIADRYRLPVSTSSAVALEHRQSDMDTVRARRDRT